MSTRLTPVRVTVFVAASVALTASAAAQSATELPAVEVTASQAKKKQAAVKKQSATPTPVAPPAEPASFQGPAELSGSPVERAGALTVPSADEARAEIQRTPGAVSLVPGDAYKTATPAVTLKDALDFTPGVFVQPKWGEDSRLSIRGSGLSRNFHGRGVQLLMDGVIPITTADGGSDFQEIDPTAYRYLEVFKGGNALRYGANQLGGAINFVMPTGYDSEAFGARLDIGSFGFRKLSASSGGVFGAADYFITGTWQEQDGFRDHSAGDSVRGAMNIGYKLSRDVETRFYLNANNIQQDIPGSVTKQQALNDPKAAFELPGEPLVGPFFPRSIGNDNVDRDYERNVESIRFANRTAVRLSQGTLLEAGGFVFRKELDHPILFVLDNRTRDYGGFARITNDAVIGGYRNQFVAGVTVHNGETRSRFYRNNLGARGDLFQDRDQISDNTVVYAENSFFVLPYLAFVGGIQYVNAHRELDDRIGDVSGEADFSFWNPKVGIVWDVTKTAQVFANVSKSGEAPTFSEITIDATSTTSLKPQEAVTYEIGTRGRSENFNYEIALYRSNLDNEFQCLTTDNSLCAQANADKTIHQGVELGVGAAIWQGLFERDGAPDKLWLNLAYTFSDFRFDNDAQFGNNELPGAPRHYLRAELLYKHPSGVFAGPNVEWVPQAYYVDNANTLETEAYALLGAKVGYEGEKFTAYIEGRNLTDETYISSVSIAGDANGNDGTFFEPGTGRAVYGGISMKW